MSTNDRKEIWRGQRSRQGRSNICEQSKFEPCSIVGSAKKMICKGQEMMVIRTTPDS